MYTDGSVAVVALQDCQSADPQFDSNAKGASFKPGNYAFRYIRRQILTFRNDICAPTSSMACMMSDGWQ